MRVASNSFPTLLVDQLNSLAGRQQRLQNQAATGQRVQNPEDDPVAMRRVLDIQVESRSLEQYQRNIDRQQELANASFTTIKSLKTISDRASEIATLADGLKSPQQLAIYATEVTELIKQAAQLANVKNRNDYLFGGTLADQPPFVVAANANGEVTSVTYQGNETVSEMEVAEGVTLTSVVPGSNNSGSGPTGLITDPRTGADFFNHLISLQNHLVAGDLAGIQNVDRAALAKDEDNFILHFGRNGAIQARLEANESVVKNRSASLEQRVSKEADADLAQTLVKLNETQNAYRAALQTAGTILSQSLLDYLR